MSTVIVTPENSAGTVAEETATGATEAVAEAAVEVAEVQAERDVAIAEIEAETQSEAIAVNAQASASQEEINECRQSIGSLTQQMALLAEQVVSIQSTLTTLVTSQASPQPDPESDDSEVIPDSQEAHEPEPRKKKRLRWI